MQVSQINNTTFNSRQRFLNEDAFNNFKNIKKKIGTCSVICAGQNLWRTRVGYLRTDDVFFSNIEPSLVILGKSELSINNDGSVNISKKPFLQTKNSIMRKLSNCLAIFDNMYEVKNVVEKKYITDTGYIDENDGKFYITKREWIKSV